MVMYNVPKIDIGRGFSMREMRKSDAERYMQIYNMEGVKEFIPDSMIPHSVEDARLQLEYVISSSNNKNTPYWAIVDSNNFLIGSCGFIAYESYHKRLEMAYDIHQDFWRMGIASAAIKSSIAYAFQNTLAERVDAFTLWYNEKSVNLLLKLGFTHEGLLRNYRQFKGKMQNINIFSYIYEDYSRDVFKDGSKI